MNNCQWIGNSPGMKPACCNEAVKDRSYCKDHIFDVYQKGSARARRKKDERIAASVWNIQDEFNKAIEELIAEGFDI